MSGFLFNVVAKSDLEQRAVKRPATRRPRSYNEFVAPRHAEQSVYHLVLFI